MVKKNTCIFISGRGSNLKNLIKRTRDYNFPIKIKLIICNNKNALGIAFAKKKLYGYMKIISKRFLRDYGKKIINIHPSLLPKFKGLNTYSRILEKKEKKSGCTVHYVNEKLDAGNIIIKKLFFINSSDNENTLKKKTQLLEYKAYPEAIIKIFRGF